jgi:PIN domain nuclease of toxin-antitoxin system
LPVRILPADAALSLDAATLRPRTLKGGLSPGDRTCLAQARRESIPALTAERRSPDIAYLIR